MNRVWTALMLCVVVLDAAIVAERAAFGGGQRELLHGLGILIAPLYLAWIASCLWVLLWLAVVLKGRAFTGWVRAVALGGLALMPVLM